MSKQQQQGKDPSRRSRGDRLRQLCLRAIGVPLGLYVCLVLLGTIPVNKAFEPAADGIEIFLVSSSVHADIVVPLATEGFDWRDRFSSRYFSGDTRSATLAVVGWGDRAFFTATPTWANLRLTTAVKALFWPTEACMHVYLLGAKALPVDARSVKISPVQYGQLVEYIDESFRRNADGSLIPIPNVAYGANDAFFEARGRYSLFNTCNSWVGRAMQVTGVRTGWFTPLPKTVFLHLPDSRD